MAHGLEVPGAAASDKRPAIEKDEWYAGPNHNHPVMAADKPIWVDIDDHKTSLGASSIPSDQSFGCKSSLSRTRYGFSSQIVGYLSYQGNPAGSRFRALQAPMVIRVEIGQLHLEPRNMPGNPESEAVLASGPAPDYRSK
jgi:hypothetical protein